MGLRRAREHSAVAGGRAMSNVRRFLDISTAHLDAGDRDYLEACADPDSCFGLSTGRMPYGWFVYATDDPGAYSDDELPPHIRAICAYARDRGCDFILFDADAGVDPNLPTFEEDSP